MRDLSHISEKNGPGVGYYSVDPVEVKPARKVFIKKADDKRLLKIKNIIIQRK